MSVTIGSKDAIDALEAESTIDFAGEFLRMLDAYHSKPEKFDDKLDAELHEQFAEVLRNKKFFDFRSVPYFSPSSANSCPRELYMKVKKAKRDVGERQPHQGRWTRHGTAIGDSLQRDLVFIEKHFAKMVGEEPPFKLLRTRDGYPAFEDFVKTMKKVEFPDANGEVREFSIFGKPDGIMKHVPSGTKIGLELKSKQTTAQQTGYFKMREPNPDHVKQVVAYSIMYGVDDFIIAYLNGSKKSWVMDEETYAKNPDVRAFHIKVRDKDREELLGFFAEIVRRVADNDPPKLDLNKWSFNGYKTACALDLSEEEISELEDEVSKVSLSSAPNYVKEGVFSALQEIKQIREAR